MTWITRVCICLAIGASAAGGYYLKRPAPAHPAPPPAIQGKPIDAAPAVAAAGSEEFPPSIQAPSGHAAKNHGAGGAAMPFSRMEKAEKEFPFVGFERLAGYLYSNPGARREGDTSVRPDQIPADVRALDGKKACVLGYMMPIEMEGDRITSFYLMRNVPQCCFGVVPQVNEWVIVTMDKGAENPEHKLTPVAVEGVLEVGEREVDGWVESVYRMKASQVLTSE